MVNHRSHNRLCGIVGGKQGVYKKSKKSQQKIRSDFNNKIDY